MPEILIFSSAICSVEVDASQEQFLIEANTRVNSFESGDTPLQLTRIGFRMMNGYSHWFYGDQKAIAEICQELQFETMIVIATTGKSWRAHEEIPPH